MTRARAVDAAATVGALLGLIGLGWLVGVLVGDPRLDRSITDWVVRHRTGALDRLAPYVTDLGSPTVYVPVTLVTVVLLGLVARRSLRVVVTPVLALLGVTVLSDAVKHLVGRTRPPVELRMLGVGGFAFPSGHTIKAMVVWGAAALLLGAMARGRARTAIHAIGALVIVGVGLSRLYLGVHWATDVVAGWALGAAWLTVLLRRIEASSPTG